MNTIQNCQIRVLHLDDEPISLDITRLFLEKSGNIKVDSVNHVHDALRLLASSRYDALISDYEMPVMDGIEFLKEIRESGYDLPFILYTGRGREEVVIRAFNNGATFYLQKGGDTRSQFTELTQKVTQAAGQYRAKQKIQHLYQIFQSLRTVSGTLHGSEEIDNKLQKVCDYLSSGKGYQNVRIVLFNRDNSIRAVYQSGLDERIDELITYLKAGNRTSCTRRALEMRPDPVICEPSQTCSACPLFSDHQGQYALTMRLEHACVVYGIISVTLSSDFAEDFDEQAMFSELANVIAYAIHHYSLEEEQTAMEILMGTSRKLHIINSITRHDIRNQLTTQMNIYELLLECAESVPEIRQYITILGSSINSIQEHLVFADVYQKIGIQRPRWLSISAIIEGITCSHEFGDIAILHSVGGIEVFTDVMFGKIVTNLIENAIMHGKRVSTIRIGFQELMHQGVLIVEDDGIGVADELKEKIFERGFGNNTGLGLYYTREILGITGMEISETGVPYEGARFEIKIPKKGYRKKKGSEIADLTAPLVSEGV
ncbi:MAG: response regulator [Methanospirillum sp.]|uniref:ATP-binding response regulator n=1 Tax=Methanospirillum sp. TaxID=45200 RepID=UPI00236C5525|nr:response regulator [Methanospirillum sp.]MDD1729483.1 response regulator [Methanospirillum sp.]